MRERRAEVLSLLVALLLPLFFPALAYAEGASTSATVLNTAPALDNLDLSPDDNPESPGVQVITLNPSTNKTVTIVVTASDDNGWDDVTTVTAAIMGPSVIAESLLNLRFDSAINITTARYNGSFNLSEHSEGEYIVTVTATDANGLNDSISTNFTYCYSRLVYALWANSTKQRRAIHLVGGRNLIIGAVHSNNDIGVSGWRNMILGATEYISSFFVYGYMNIFIPPPTQVSPRPMPIHYNSIDYAPGGSEARAAEVEGKYHYIRENFRVSRSDVVLDGLYYVDGKVRLNGNRISGVFTIVAERDIDISGSGHNCSAYSSNSLFLAGNNIRLSGSKNCYHGIIYTEEGEITLSGSKNTLNGGLFGDTVKLFGSKLKITAFSSTDTDI
ncbi:MAG: hypothetical protein JW878_06710 [Methanomicrobia archaeon]|nr:hypothetical protein [Methanomicrobia archaeon]